MDQTTVEMSLEEFHLMNEVIGRRFGLNFPEHKKSALESRLRPRVADLGLGTFGDYYMAVVADRNGEMELLAKAITNNETYFFRERHQFDAVFHTGLAELIPGLARPGVVRVLCAGVSSGEEAYTLRFYATDHAYRLLGAQLEVDAIDIDHDRIRIGQRGVYRVRSVRHMSDDEIKRYFTPAGPDLFEVKPWYRSGLRFSVGNIVDVSTYYQAFRYDVVFCRNVLIYFASAAFEQAIENLAGALRPGGLLFLGHSESIIGMSRHFEAVRFPGCIAYRRLAT